MSDAAGAVVLVGRILFAGFFGVVSGWGHVSNSKMMEGYAASMRFPVSGIAGWPTGIWLMAASISIGLGIWPDVGALMIAAFLIPAAAYFHRYWQVHDEGKMMQRGFFWRNVIGVGACLMMFGMFVTLGPALRFTITEPLFSF